MLSLSRRSRDRGRIALACCTFKEIRVAVKFYDRVIQFHEDHKMKAAMRGEPPFLSLTWICGLMGWKDSIHNRKKAQRLKRVTDKTGVLTWISNFKTGARRADSVILGDGSPETPPNQPMVYVVGSRSVEASWDAIRAWSLGTRSLVST